MIDIHDVEDIIRLHDSIVKEYGGLPGIHDERLLASAITRPFTGLTDGTEFFGDIENKAAALLHSLIQYHPFVDGNKRTGVAVTQIYLLEAGFHWKFDQNEIVDFAIDIAASRISLNQIALWIRDRLQKRGPENG